MKEISENNYVLENKKESDRLNFQVEHHNYDPRVEIPPNMLNLCKGQRILDAGCGAGALSKLLLEYNDSLKIDAVDFSLDRIKQLKSELTKLNADINFYQENLKDLPFPDSTFDLVFCRFVYQHNPSDIQLITNELYRVLKNLVVEILMDLIGCQAIVVCHTNVNSCRNEIYWSMAYSQKWLTLCVLG